MDELAFGGFPPFKALLLRSKLDGGWHGHEEPNDRLAQLLVMLSRTVGAGVGSDGDNTEVIEAGGVGEEE